MDDIDRANERTEQITEADIQRIREQAAYIPQGNSGTCGLCGEWSGRLVGGVCAPCRDRYRLP